MNKKILTALFILYLIALGGFCYWKRSVLFAWPAGIVTGNLLASAIWAPLAVIHLDRLAVKHHREHMALIRRHHKEVINAVCDSEAGGNGELRGDQ
jgi:hypothetical protein